MTPDHVLLITIDPAIRQRVTEACQSIDAQMTHTGTLEEASGDLEKELPNLVVCDNETFRQLQRQYPRACAVLYADPESSEQAIEAIKQGALDYLVTPFETTVLAQHIRDALRISRDIHVPAVYNAPVEDSGVERIIGQSPSMREVYKLIGRIAPRDVNVLVTGESGTGKELIARALLHHSPRKDRPFLAVNCAAIPETLIESELFGHEQGAFTGANHRRIGKFEQCNGGTLFLDEIGDIPLATQAKLLRVLQDNSFQRLGGTELITTDVRIIGATHQPLEQMIEKGTYRQDLYFRLKVASIDVPPLREREVDVVLLAHHFMRRFNRSLGTDIQTISPDVLPVLLRYPWPGNVRELENAIKSALVVSRGTILRLEFLPEHIRKEPATSGAFPASMESAVPTDAQAQARSIAEHLASQTN
ncbi:MAG: sigma-54-dependent transcriptional regulator, partial [Phycisphaerae bacterium]